MGSPPTLPPLIPHRPPDERQILTMVRWLLIVLFVVLGWIVLRYIAIVLGPILAAAAIAYLLQPVVDRLVARRMPRALAALVLLISFVGTLVGLVMVFAPMVAHQVAVFVTDLPRLIGNLVPWVEGTFYVDLPNDWQAYFQSDEFRELVGDASGPVRAVATMALGGALGGLGVLAELLLVPVFAFYFLVDWPNITRRAIRFIPPRRRPRILDIMREIDGVVSGWVRGQATVIAILAVLYAISFSIAGMPLAIPIGLLVGVLTVIPFVGTLVGAAIAIGITLADGANLQGVGVIAGVIGVLHLLEAAVLTPKIVGHRVGLGESAALFAVVAGGKLLGFVGILLAVPLAATVAVLLRHLVRAYEHTEFFGSEVDAVVPVTAGMAIAMPASRATAPRPSSAVGPIGLGPSGAPAPPTDDPAAPDPSPAPATPDPEDP